MSSETIASNSSSVNKGNDASSITIDLRPLLEDVSKLMTTHISRMLEGVVGEYTTYKETHDIIMSLPCVKRMQQRVEELESQLNTGSSSNQQKQNENEHRTSSQEQTNDYNETMQLKGAVDELTKYIKHLESCISASGAGSGAGDGSGSLSDKDNAANITVDMVDNETLRLEVHENDVCEEEDETEDDDTDEDHTKNEIVTVVRADEVVDHDNDNDNEEECSEDETGDGDVSDTDAIKVSEVPDEALDTEEAVDEEEEAVDEEEEAEAEAEAVDEEEEAADEEAVDEEEEEAADEEEAVTEEEAAEDEIEVSEVKIKGKTYFTTNAQNGIIYACVNDDVGDEVGVFKNGIALFNSKK